MYLMRSTLDMPSHLHPPLLAIASALACPSPLFAHLQGRLDYLDSLSLPDLSSLRSQALLVWHTLWA